MIHAGYMDELQRALVAAGYVIAGRLSLNSSEVEYRYSVQDAEQIALLVHKPNIRQFVTISINDVLHEFGSRVVFYRLRTQFETPSVYQIRNLVGHSINYDHWDYEHTHWKDAEGNNDPPIPGLQLMELDEMRRVSSGYAPIQRRVPRGIAYHDGGDHRNESFEDSSGQKVRSVKQLVGWIDTLFQQRAAYLLKGKMGRFVMYDAFDNYFPSTFEDGQLFKRLFQADIDYLRHFADFIEYPYEISKQLKEAKAHAESRKTG